MNELERQLINLLRDQLRFELEIVDDYDDGHIKVRMKVLLNGVYITDVESNIYNIKTQGYRWDGD